MLKDKNTLGQDSLVYQEFTVGMMNFPVRRQTAGSVQYASNGMEVKG